MTLELEFFFNDQQFANMNTSLIRWSTSIQWMASHLRKICSF